jgi:hypothetical protein
MQRPTGLIVIAVIDFITAALGATSGIMRIIAGINTDLVPFIFAFAAFLTISGIGLLLLKGWGRTAHIAVAAVLALGGVGDLMNGLPQSTLVLVISVILLTYYAWTIWYIFTPGIKQVFSPPQQN